MSEAGLTGPDGSPADSMAAPAARRGGRPSRQQAEQLGETILEIATELFIANGYGATSIEAVAERARISKRTFYHRFADKPDLFRAVVHRILERLRPSDGVPLFDGEDLEAVLTRLARLILGAALSPDVVALHRMILAEAVRFPELAAASARDGTRSEVVAGIAALLRREAAAGRVAVANPEFAAAQFIQMVIAIPQRLAMGLGPPMTGPALERWASDTVELFLRGCRYKT